MNILAIQNCVVEGFGRYSEFLLDRRVNLIHVRAYAGEALPPLDTVDAVLVGGTPIAAHDVRKPDFLRKEIGYLGGAVFAGTPCLGICFGAQILGQILGAQVRKAERMEIGCCEVRLTNAGAADPLLRGFPEQFPVFQWHADTFAVPPGGDLLVEGDACRNQMFRSSHVVGVLFHLESTSMDAAAWADTYADELSQCGKTRDEVVAECSTREREMGALASMLMDNFLEDVS